MANDKFRGGTKTIRLMCYDVHRQNNWEWRIYFVTLGTVEILKKLASRKNTRILHRLTEFLQD